MLQSGFYTVKLYFACQILRASTVWHVKNSQTPSLGLISSANIHTDTIFSIIQTRRKRQRCTHSITLSPDSIRVWIWSRGTWDWLGICEGFWSRWSPCKLSCFPADSGNPACLKHTHHICLGSRREKKQEDVKKQKHLNGRVMFRCIFFPPFKKLFCQPWLVLTSDWCGSIEWRCLC